MERPQTHETLPRRKKRIRTDYQNIEKTLITTQTRKDGRTSVLSPLTATRFHAGSHPSPTPRRCTPRPPGRGLCRTGGTLSCGRPPPRLQYGLYENPTRTQDGPRHHQHASGLLRDKTQDDQDSPSEPKGDDTSRLPLGYTVSCYFIKFDLDVPKAVHNGSTTAIGGLAPPEVDPQRPRGRPKMAPGDFTMNPR